MEAAKRKAHPKFVERWASEYVRRLLSDGEEDAQKWAVSFFNLQDLPEIAKLAREILIKKGFTFND